MMSLMNTRLPWEGQPGGQLQQNLREAMTEHLPKIPIIQHHCGVMENVSRCTGR